MDTFEILTLVVVGSFIINAVLDYRSKRFDSVPGALLMAFLFSLSIVIDYIPEGIKTSFIYTAAIIATLGSLLISQFHRKRNNKFEYWFFGVFAMLLFLTIILGAVGVIPIV